MSKQKIALFFILALLILIGYLYRDELNLHDLKLLIHQAGMWAPMLFTLIYVVLTILVFPVFILTISSGALFGPWLGTFYSLTAATIGSTISFILARYLFQEAVTRRSGKMLKKIIRGVNEEGWQFVAFIRLVPLFPFNVINYIFGLTEIRLSHYVIATYVCMLPGAAAYAYIGYLGSSVAMGNTENLIKKSLLAISLLAIIIFIPRVIIKYRKRAKKK